MMRYLSVLITLIGLISLCYAQLQWATPPPTEATNTEGVTFTIQGPQGSTSQVNVTSSLAAPTPPDPRVSTVADSGEFVVSLDGGSPSTAVFSVTFAQPGLHTLFITLVGDDTTILLQRQITIIPTQVIVGGSFDSTWPDSASVEMVVKLATELINSDSAILPKTNFILSDPVYAECKSSLGISTSLPLFQEEHVVALIGPSCSGVAQTVSTLAQVYQVPIIGYDASNPLLSNKDVYPYFLRVVAPSYYETLSLIAFAQHMGWNPVSVVMVDTYQISPDVFRIAEKMNMTIAASVILPSGCSFDEAVSRMTAIKTAGSKVIISNIYGSSGKSKDLDNMIAAATQLGLVGAGNTWLFEGSAGQTVKDVLPDEVSRGFNGSFTLTPGDTIGDKVLRKKTVDLWNKKDRQTYVNHPDWDLIASPAVEDVDGMQNTLYGDLSRTFDTAYVVARALHKIFYVDPITSPFDGSQLLQAMFESDFLGVSGNVSFDVNGDFHVPWAINNFQFTESTTGGGLTKRSSTLQKNSVQVAKIVPGEDFTFEMEIVKPVDNVWFSTGVGQKPPAFLCEQGCDHGTCVAHNTCVCEKDWVDDPVSGRSCSIPVLENVITSTSGAGIAIMLIFAVLIVILLASLVALGIFRMEPNIRAISPFFCGLFVVGLLFVAGGVYGYIGRPTTAKCLVQAWLISIGYSLAMGALFTKTWRLMRIFGNEKLQNMSLTDKRILLLTIFVVAIDILLLIIWSTVETPEPRRFDLDDGYSYRCVSHNDRTGSFSAILAYTGSLMLINTIVAYRTRGITTMHNESRFIGIAVYNVALCSLVVIAVVYGIPQTSNMFRFLIIALACFVSIVACWALLIGRPLLLLWQVKRRRGGGNDGPVSPDMLRTAVRKGSKQVDISNETMTYMLVPVQDQTKWVKQWKKHHLTFVYQPVGAILLREEGKECGIFADRTQVTATHVEPTDEYKDCFELRFGRSAYIVQANSTEEAEKWVDLVGREEDRKKRNGSGNAAGRGVMRTLSMSGSGGKQSAIPEGQSV